MKRAITMPAILADAALAELKDWLAITTTSDDETLRALLRAALDTCEAFTGVMPLVAGCSEVLRATRDWQRIAATPVMAITGVDELATDGSRTALPVDGYLIDITAGGCGRVRLMRAPATSRIVVQFEAGMAPDWYSLPDGMRHGVLRLAAHQYRERDQGGTGQVPPSSVAALWQPWRRMRLA
ncbi:head-tail connector protein [Aurantiacibacter poecillastricola]|uniref:head-tail connector protein n=1 Tax=Aurantiacibacter poecillastricola TaxID=3064385 RepID=UPI00273CF541|nr:hypothetical protein [Aurantiacibacter sp. 219JJ12-13]MDP5260309.1 hypothetical protein [Aurantiacibacter sp. 219JJ12-13]